MQGYSSHDADILVDIIGYFTDSTAISNLVFYPITPCRVVETRTDYLPSPGPFGPQPSQKRETRLVPAALLAARTDSHRGRLCAHTNGDPTRPSAISQRMAGGDRQPNVSQINSPGGRVLANSVVPPASTDGSIDVYAFDRSDLWSTSLATSRPTMGRVCSTSQRNAESLSRKTSPCRDPHSARR